MGDSTVLKQCIAGQGCYFMHSTEAKLYKGGRGLPGYERHGSMGDLVHSVLHTVHESNEVDKSSILTCCKNKRFKMQPQINPPKGLLKKIK